VSHSLTHSNKNWPPQSIFLFIYLLSVLNFPLHNTIQKQKTVCHQRFNHPISCCSWQTFYYFGFKVVVNKIIWQRLLNLMSIHSIPSIKKLKSAPFSSHIHKTCNDKRKGFHLHVHLQLPITISLSSSFNNGTWKNLPLITWFHDSLSLFSRLCLGWVTLIGLPLWVSQNFYFSQLNIKAL
jgi:hypothetical protein